MTQYIVLDALIQHADHRTGYCFPSRRLIAEQIGIDPVTVSTATSRLQKLGIIAKFGGGGYSSSCDYVILFSQESFSLAGMLQRGELNRFGLRNRSCPVPINLEEAIAYGLAASCKSEINGSSNPEIKRNEQAQIKGFILTSVDTQPEETTDSKPRKNPRRPSTPILRALPEHWLEDGKQKRPDLDIRHVADKFLAYHNRKGVRATPRWYAAWIRWVERENPALDRRSTPVQESSSALARTAPGNTTQPANTPTETSPTVPQTGTSAPTAVTETPAPVAQEPPASADVVTAAAPESTTTASTPAVTNTSSPAEPTASVPVDNTTTPDSTTDGNPSPSVETTSQVPTPSPAAGFPDFGNDEQARRRHIEEMMTTLRAGRAGAQHSGNQANSSSH
ncbi:MAG: helix-turn-helix domain-containing protein [Pseudomonadota bacterium]|nr:helix-turn-helix domain-containing protein [Pseudomonadota bacterium]